MVSTITKVVQQNNSFPSTYERLASRDKRLAELGSRLLNSNVLRFVTLSAFLAGSVAIIALSVSSPVIVVAASVGSLALLILGLHVGVNFKKIVYELTLFATLALKNLRPTTYAWWHLIIPNLYLGALPLKNFSHDQQLVDKLGIKAVLSVVEDFEFNTKGVFTVPCRSKDWKALHVEHLVLPVQDLCPLSSETLEKGVRFLENHIANGQACYVHCKAGRSRSAIMVLAYLLKMKIVPSVSEGEDFLKQKRPIVSISKREKSVFETFLKNIPS